MKSKISGLEDHAGFWLRKLSNAVSQSFAERVERHGVSVANWVVLRVLYDHEALALKDIVERVGVDQGSLSRMVDRLLEKDLVERVENPDDRRAVRISLTRVGRQLVPKLAREADENDKAFFAALPARKREELLVTIETLLETNGVNPAEKPLD
jgi:DNA-binding MarR family transcriptional regulator